MKPRSDAARRRGGTVACGAALAAGDLDAGSPPTAVRARLLANEHWSLLATRGTTQSEMLTRITMFLMLISASLISARGFMSEDRVEPIGYALGSALTTEFALDAVGDAR